MHQWNSPRVRFFKKSIHARNPSARTDCRGGGGEAGEPLGTGVFRQFSLAGNQVAALHLATCIFLVGNHNSDKQRDKEQERVREKRRLNLRNLSNKSLQRSRVRKREIFL